MNFQNLENNCPSDRVFNPTGCKVGDKTYLLFRAESRPKDSLPPMHKHENEWGHSTCSYWIEAYDGFNPIGEHAYAEITVNDHSYTEIRRVDVTEECFIFEDIRIIHGTATIDEHGDDCCLATFNACRDMSKPPPWITNSERDVKVAVCSINLSKKTIKFLHYIDINSQKKFEKNWAVLQHNDLYYSVYAFSPFTYTEAKSLDELTYENELPTDPDKPYSMSCHPLPTSEGFVMLLHKKLKQNGQVYGYEFYSAKLQAKDELKRVGNIHQTNVLSKYYCCSLLNTDEGVVVLAGMLNKSPVYSFLEIPQVDRIPLFYSSKKYLKKKLDSE